MSAGRYFLVPAPILGSIAKEVMAWRAWAKGVRDAVAAQRRALEPPERPPGAAK